MPVNEHYADLISYLLYLRTLHALYLNNRIERTTYITQLNDLLGIPGSHSHEGSIHILLKSLNIGTLNELRKLLKSYEIDPAETSTIEYLLLERKIISGEPHQKINKDILRLAEGVTRVRTILTSDVPLTFDDLLTYISDLIFKARKITDDIGPAWPVLTDLKNLQEQIKHEARSQTNLCPADLKTTFADSLNNIYDKIC